jgi:exosortase/archaeosortase family protein
MTGRALIARVRARPWLVFALTGVPAAVALYAFIYFPHDQASLTGRALATYVTWQAAAVAAILGLFDGTVSVAGHHIAGRFPLDIVLDCAALDVQALYGVAVLAFPGAALASKGVGLIGGLAVITGFNLLRMVALYAVGVSAPESFGFLHEEVFQLLMVAIAAASFWIWTSWSLGRGAAPLPA